MMTDTYVLNDYEKKIFTNSSWRKTFNNYFIWCKI